MTLVAELQLLRGELEIEVQLHAAPGETVALLGPNGAGKTTCLRVLAGLQRLDSGRVELDGTVLEDTRTSAWTPPERRRAAVVFQQLVLFPHLDVLDNVAFGLRARGLPRGEARRRATTLLQQLDLEVHARKRPAALSGGQAQQVALAQAMATRPRLLLLDEPLASVDASARIALRRLLRQQLAAYDGVRVVVTHDPLEAAALADRVVILEGGRVIQEGSFATVAARPRSEWVARMVGLNLLHGESGSGVLRLASGAELAVVGGVTGPALATIHPRAVALHRRAPDGSPRNVVRCTVAGIDNEGDRWRVQLDGSLPLVAEVTASAAAELRLAEGGEVYAAVKATEVEVYPE